MTYQEIYKDLKKKVRNDYGKRCPDFCFGCSVCEAYLALSFLEGCVAVEKKELKEKKQKYERKNRDNV